MENLHTFSVAPSTVNGNTKTYCSVTSEESFIEPACEFFCYIFHKNFKDLIRRHDNQHNDTQHNDNQHNDTQHNDNNQHNDTRHNDTQHTDTQHNDTLYNNK